MTVYRIEEERDDSDAVVELWIKEDGTPDGEYADVLYVDEYEDEETAWEYAHDRAKELLYR